MKRILLVLLFLSLEIACARDVIAVSIPMQKEFVQKIAGDSYRVISMVTQGVNPHDFEPKISEIKEVNIAVAYLSIGIEFEETWLPRFKNQNKAMRTFATDKGVEKINFALEAHHAHASHEHEHGDTHIWLSTKNALKIAENIYNALMSLNPNASYTESYERLIAEIAGIDKELQEILKKLPKHQKFVVFHPMLGYFARDYHLEEIAIEVEGKSPKMKEMIEVIETIKREHLKVVFAQPEFSVKSAEFISKESGAKLGYFSPLQTPWGENLLTFAKTLVELQGD